MERRNYKQAVSQHEPSIYREANKRDIKNFREREKAKEHKIKKNGSFTSYCQYKMKKARNKIHVLSYFVLISLARKRTTNKEHGSRPQARNNI